MTLSERYRQHRGRAIADWVRQVPEEFQAWELTTLARDEFNREAIEKLEGLVDELENVFKKGINLVLSGKVGVGKTALAWAFARAIVGAPAIAWGADPIQRWERLREDGADPINRVAFWSLRELVRSEQRDIDRETKVAPLDSAKRAEFLFLDDVGVRGTTTDSAQGYLFELLDYRYTKHLPTFVTTNLPLAQGKESKLDPAIVDRLTATSRTVMRSLLGDSRRRSR